jgi:hypothetical protein
MGGYTDPADSRLPNHLARRNREGDVRETKPDSSAVGPTISLIFWQSSSEVPDDDFLEAVEDGVRSCDPPTNRSCWTLPENRVRTSKLVPEWT